VIRDGMPLRALPYDPMQGQGHGGSKVGKCPFYSLSLQCACNQKTDGTILQDSI